MEVVAEKKEFPVEILMQFYSYLTAKQICKAQSVCKSWWNAGNQSPNWRRLCFMEWKGKIGIENELHYRVDYSNLTHDLSMKEIKRILIKRGKQYAMRNFIEKREFLKLLLETTPTPTYGRWSNKWKSSYIVALKDSKRTEITKDELCSLPWYFRFKHRPEHVFESKFEQDYKFLCPDLVQGELTWRFYVGAVQVAGYPEHYFTRNPKNWSWIGQNEAGIFTNTRP
jgi:F-box-like